MSKRSRAAHSRNSVGWYLLIAALLLFFFFSNDFGLIDIQENRARHGVGIDRDEEGFVGHRPRSPVPQSSAQGKEAQAVQLESRGETVGDAPRTDQRQDGMVSQTRLLQPHRARRRGGQTQRVRLRSISFCGTNTCRTAVSWRRAKGRRAICSTPPPPIDPISSVAAQKVLSRHASKVGYRRLRHLARIRHRVFLRLPQRLAPRPQSGIPAGVLRRKRRERQRRRTGAGKRSRAKSGTKRGRVHPDRRSGRRERQRIGQRQKRKRGRRYGTDVQRRADLALFRRGGTGNPDPRRDLRLLHRQRRAAAGDVHDGERRRGLYPQHQKEPRERKIPRGQKRRAPSRHPREGVGGTGKHGVFPDGAPKFPIPIPCPKRC